jgi:hypothetical protein
MQHYAITITFLMQNLASYIACVYMCMAHIYSVVVCHLVIPVLILLLRNMSVPRKAPCITNNFPKFTYIEQVCSDSNAYKMY